MYGTFFQPLSPSKNNITRCEYHQGGDEPYTAEVTYTYYEENSLPKTRVVDDSPIFSFSYSCY
jgi:hypothetical protein